MVACAEVTKDVVSPSGLKSEDYDCSAECSPEMETKIAELAYYKAEKRGFAPGHELEDWLEAKQDLGF
jgi:hypothetical protein